MKSPVEAKKDELEKTMAKDKLGKELNSVNRPTINEVKDSGIHKDTMRVRAESLTKEMAKTSLKGDLEKRPGPDEVKVSGSASQ